MSERERKIEDGGWRRKTSQRDVHHRLARTLALPTAAGPALRDTAALRKIAAFISVYQRLMVFAYDKEWKNCPVAA